MITVRLRVAASLGLLLLLLAAAAASAQSDTSGTLVVRVTDSLAGVLPGATVTVEGPGTDGGRHFDVTGPDGRAQFPDLAPGAYDVRVEMPGFDPVVLEALAVAPGRPTDETVALDLGGFDDEVIVTRSATERRLGESFTEELSDAEIEQLPDDPDELQEYLQALVGDDVELRINGFEGGELPPASQIMAIRIRDDPFAVDSRGGGPRVEIITRPGTSAWQQQVDFGFRDQALDARNPLADERGVGQTRRFRWNASGPLVSDRTSIALDVRATTAFNAANIVATRPEGELRDVANRESDRLDLTARLEHALTDTHTLRVEYQRRGSGRDNLGVGEFDLFERGYSETEFRHRLRVSDVGTFGDRIFNELRLQYVWSGSDRQSMNDDVTIDVQNAFRSGGAQVGGGTRRHWLEIENDLDLVLNDRHKLRMGVDGDVTWYRSDTWQNVNGTFTFASLDDYEAGHPLQFRQRIGDPLVTYSHADVDWYVQDEVRLHETLRLGLGVRHEYQSLLGDWGRFGPRASVTWTPGGERNRTTLRGGIGLSHGRYSSGVYEETLRVDGIRQQELIVADPGWPDALADAGNVELPPPSRVQAADDLSAPASRRVSLDVRHDFTEALAMRVNLFDRATWNRFRSVNVNAPIDGVVPQPEFGRITEVRSIGEETERGVDIRMYVRAEERGMRGMVRYRHARRMNDSDGAFSLPADSYNLADDWGPAGGDIRHRIFGSFRMDLPRGFRVGVDGTVHSPGPYTIRTGYDDNGDSIFNDRPAGVGRNSARGDWRQDADLRLSWASDADARRQESRPEPRRGFEVYTRVLNVFNTTNFTSYSGVMTSPYFGQPTSARDGRRLELGTRVYF